MYTSVKMTHYANVTDNMIIDKIDIPALLFIILSMYKPNYRSNKNVSLNSCLSLNPRYNYDL